MCMGGGGVPTPPPPVPPPEIPKQTDESVKKAKANQRAIAARAAGRSSTVNAGQINTPVDNQPVKTLLGQ
jgi:hypothetical protein